MSESPRDALTPPGGALKYTLLFVLLALTIVAIALSVAGSQAQVRDYANYVRRSSEQQQLAHRMSGAALEASRGNPDAWIELAQARHRFAQILSVQKDGGEDLPPPPEAVDPYLAELEARWQQALSALGALLEQRQAVETGQVQAAAERFREQGEALQAAAAALLAAYATQAAAGWAPLPQRLPGVTIGPPVLLALGALALLLLVVLIHMLRRDGERRLAESERRKRETEEQNRRNQEAILRLLDEMGDLAEGDLTVQASVTEDITGAIADAINYAIEALRDLVVTINHTSERVARAAQETRGVADSLARASEAQAQQIESASRIMLQMASSMDDVSTRTAASAEVAEKSVTLAHAGGERVRRTIEGMDAIREHIQETSKRIKRLSESSQEIGDIVALIDDLADQTNILALNAAIQASSAGEAGQGFAVVADEVQRLAERAGNATKRIETLVKTIQADTNEAIISMEASTTEVVNGAGLAAKAGASLDEIEAVSARLAELINEVSRAARQVSEMASRVSDGMVAIQEITGQTAQTSVVTASSIGQLNQLAQEMHQSVAGFRLPQPLPGEPQ